MRDSYQGMPLPQDEQFRLQPLLAHGQGQRLKPLAFCDMGGIAQAMP